MPDNQIPATQPEPEEAPAEFNFEKPSTENPRIKRRSLKAKPAGLIKPTGATLPAARELEREAPPLPAEQTPTAKPKTEAANEPAAAKTAQAPTPPPRTTPSSTPKPSQPAAASATPRAGTTSVTASTSSTTNSPHGTRPATLYYSSYPRKEKEAPAPMKTTPTTSTASSTSTPSATTPTASAPRAGTTTASLRPGGNIDYRANVERQSREQKSVGNILSYVVYTLIAFFVIGAGLAIYGADVIFKQIHDQSVTVSDLDARYAAENRELNAKLSITEDTLTQAQSQIARQQELIMRQQEDLNRLLTAIEDNATALKAEKQSRELEAASLRARVRDLENRPTFEQKY